MLKRIELEQRRCGSRCYRVWIGVDHFQLLSVWRPAVAKSSHVVRCAALGSIDGCLASIEARSLLHMHVQPLISVCWLPGLGKKCARGRLIPI